MTEMGLDFFYQIKSIKIPINPNFTADLPSDFLQYTKIGVLNNKGEIIPLKYNNKLTTYADLNPDRVQKTQDNTLANLFQFNTPIWYNFWSGDQFINLYGIPSGAPFVGDFKIDTTNSIILLNKNFVYEYVMLDYVASPVEGQQYYIPIQFRAALISYLRWQDIISIPVKTHVQNSNVGMRRHEYFNDRRLGWARYRPFRLTEAYDWNLENQRICIKA